MQPLGEKQRRSPAHRRGTNEASFAGASPSLVGATLRLAIVATVERVANREQNQPRMPVHCRRARAIGSLGSFAVDVENVA
jgi:hypothetical protein